MTFKDLNLAGKIFVCIGITMLIGIAITPILFSIDLITNKQIGTERVKCIDDEGAEFIDEWCDKDIYCSWLGLSASKRCKNVEDKIK